VKMSLVTTAMAHAKEVGGISLGIEVGTRDDGGVLTDVVVVPESPTQSEEQCGLS
jgi:hypothetical protein